MKITETDRLGIRRMSVDDCDFMLELLTDSAWLQFIGDSGARTLDDARKYISEKVVAMYQRLGFGLYLVELKSRAVPIGICGLIKRDSLEDVDIGFAFLPEYRGSGYAFESSAAVLEYGRTILGLNRIVAITFTDNDRSVGLLQRLGFTHERMINLSNGDREEMLFALDF